MLISPFCTFSALSRWDDPDLCLSYHDAQVQSPPPYCELKWFFCGLDVEGSQAGYKNVGSCLLSVMFLMLFIDNRKMVRIIWFSSLQSLSRVRLSAIP